MRPQSVQSFERFYLISLALVLVQQVVGFLFARDLIADMPGIAGLGGGGEAAVGAVVIGALLFGIVTAVGVPLLLMWLVSRKRVEVAKWLLLAISVLSVLGWIFGLVTFFAAPAPAVLASVPGLQVGILLIDFLSEALGIFALVQLFRPDATAWLRGRPVDQDVFR